MANNFLKIVFGADNRQVVQKSKESQAAVKEFEKQSAGAIDAFSNVFGASFSAMGSQVKALQGGFIALSASINGSAAATGFFSKALRVLKVALLSTGIGAIVVALGSLVAYFTRSQEGADRLARFLAPLKLLFVTIGDLAAKLGEGIVDAFSNPKEAIKTLVNFIKDQLVNRIMGVIDLVKNMGLAIFNALKFNWTAANDYASKAFDSAKQVLTGLDAQQREAAANYLKQQKDQFSERAKMAKALQDREAQLAKDKIAFMYREADMSRRIAELREITADKENKSVAERKRANDEAIALTNTLYGEKVKLAKEEYDILKGQNSLAENMNKDNQKEAELYAAMVNLQAERAARTKEMLSMNGRMAVELNKQYEAEKRMQELRNKAAIPKVDGGEFEQQGVALGSAFSNGITKAMEQGYKAYVQKSKDIAAKGKLEAASMLDAMNGAINQAVVSGIVNLSAALGEAIVTGDFSKIGKTLLQSFADLCSQLGGLLVALGVAVTLFVSNPFNGPGMIIAGAALVAIGAAVSALLGGSAKSMAAGGSSTGVGTSAGTTTTTQTNRVPLRIEVTGKLTADNSKRLVAIINNENKRVALTT